MSGFSRPTDYMASPEPMARPMPPWLAAVIVFGLTFCAVVLLKSGAVQTPAASASPSFSYDLGSVGHIRPVSGVSVMAYDDAATANAANASAAAKDEIGFRKAITGHSFTVSAGDAARVLENSFDGMVRVRFQDGSAKDREGWIHSEEIGQ